METHEVILEIPLEHERNLFGGLDCHVKKIERTLRISVILRDGAVKLVGSESAVEQAKNVFSELLTLSERGNTITEQNVDYVLALSKEHSDVSLAEIDKELIGYTIQGKPIKPKTRGQQKYVNQIPYLRPLYDALYQIMGADSFIKNSEKGLIEVAPLAYMRGRTLDNAFIILDEAQNTTPAQMKMFLTRIGFGSKVVITGDLSQKDLPFQTQSGLEQASKVLEQVEDIGFSYLTNKDVVRHPLVQKIVHAYEKYEARENYKESRKKASTQTKKAGKR